MVKDKPVSLDAYEFDNTLEKYPKQIFEEVKLEDIEFKLTSVVNLLSVIARQNELMLRKIDRLSKSAH